MNYQCCHSWRTHYSYRKFHVASSNRNFTSGSKFIIFPHWWVVVAPDCQKVVFSQFRSRHQSDTNSGSHTHAVVSGERSCNSQAGEGEAASGGDGGGAAGGVAGRFRRPIQPSQAGEGKKERASSPCFHSFMDRTTRCRGGKRKA